MEILINFVIERKVVMKNKISTLVILLILTASVGAQSFSIGPQIGFIKTKDADKASIMPAIAARLNLIGLKVEGSIGYKSDEYGSGEIKTKSYPILLTGMLSVFPFIHAEAGIGWYNTKIDYSSALQALGAKNETTQDIGYHLGAGAELPLGNVVLTGDIRYVFLNVDFNNTVKLASQKSDYYTINVGLLFKL